MQAPRKAASPQTRSIVLALVAVLMYLAGLFTMQDFAQWFVPLDTPCGDCSLLWPQDLTLFSRAIRMLRTVLCLALVWIISKDLWLTEKDRRRLLIAFVFALIGDIFLIFEGTGLLGGEIIPPQYTFIPGVLAFLVCHGWLIARHMVSVSDFRADLKRPGVAPRVWGLAVVSFVPSIAVVAIFWDEIKPALDGIYMFTLSLSLWMGLSVIPRRDDFPKVNRGLIAGGMVLFYICDVSLGMHVRLAEAYPLLAGIFGQIPNLSYSWALIALALSGYHWRSLTQDRGMRGTPIQQLERALAELLDLDALRALDQVTHQRLKGSAGHYVWSARDTQVYATSLLAALGDGAALDTQFFSDLGARVSEQDQDQVDRLRRVWLEA